MKTKIDYLKFRTKSDPRHVLAALKPCLGFVDPDLLTLGPQGEGRDGWAYRRALVIAGDVVIGQIDYGGDSQRGVVRVDLPGSGCQWVQDWSVVQGLPQVLQEASIMRLDIALDTFNGEVTHELVCEAHDARQFGTGGRHPHRREVVGSDPRAGRTVYVGKRESGKFLRCYEKGWEMLKDYPQSVRDMVESITLDDGRKVDPARMYRVEVELKDRDSRPVPWEAIGDRDAYFAGAYPFCAGLLPGVEVQRVKALPEVGAKLALATALDHCRRSYGATIRAAIMAYGGDVDRVMRLITTESPADALVAAGVLTVYHGPANAPGTREKASESRDRVAG